MSRARNCSSSATHSSSIGRLMSRSKSALRGWNQSRELFSARLTRNWIASGSKPVKSLVDGAIARLLVESPAVHGALRSNLEAAALVDAEGAVRVLGVHAQPAVRHPASPQERKARGDEGPRESPPTPVTPHADVLDPPAFDAQANVLLGVDVAADHPGDPVAVPRHAPQARVRLDRV